MKMSPHSLVGTQRPHEASCWETKSLSGRLGSPLCGDDNEFPSEEASFELSPATVAEVSGTFGH